MLVRKSESLNFLLFCFFTTLYNAEDHLHFKDLKVNFKRKEIGGNNKKITQYTHTHTHTHTFLRVIEIKHKKELTGRAPGQRQSWTKFQRKVAYIVQF